jgi:hypothetical protein
VKVRDTAQGVITIYDQTAQVEAGSKCYVMLTTPRSLQLKQLHALSLEQMLALRLRPQPKLRSNSWHFETATDG